MKKQNKLFNLIWFVLMLFPIIYIVACSIASSGNTSLDIESWWTYVSSNFSLLENVPLFDSWISIFSLLFGNVSIDTLSSNIFVSIICYYSFYIIILYLIRFLIDIITFIPKTIMVIIERWVA